MRYTVLDCTIRDGGLINHWQFSHGFVREVLRVLTAAGVDYMEIGYRSSERYSSPAENGAWRFCAEDDLRRVLEGIESPVKLSAMADVGRLDLAGLAPRASSALEMIRVACYAHQIEEGIALAQHALALGYQATINLMAVSSIGEGELDRTLEALARSSVPTIYLVDSFGALIPAAVRTLMQKYAAALPGRQLGVHAHNNLELAFANTIEAAGAGATLLDATLYGMGRGAGNCPLELLLAFLDEPDHDLRPVLDVVQDLFIPLKRELGWGYHPAYLVTGARNQHPRWAMEAVAADSLPRLGEAYARLGAATDPHAGHSSGQRGTTK